MLKSANFFLIADLCNIAVRAVIPKVSVQDRVEFKRTVEIYGSVRDKCDAVTYLAEKFFETAVRCTAFTTMQYQHFLQALKSVYLISTEEQKLSIVIKWTYANIGLSKS